VLFGNQLQFRHTPRVGIDLISFIHLILNQFQFKINRESKQLQIRFVVTFGFFGLWLFFFFLILLLYNKIVPFAGFLFAFCFVFFGFGFFFFFFIFFLDNQMDPVPVCLIPFSFLFFRLLFSFIIVYWLGC
jgi:hypothetical protein